MVFAVQPHPEGLAQALVIAEDFLAGGPSALILGDNLFFGRRFNSLIDGAMAKDHGATVFGYHVKNPQEYGVVGFDENRRANSIEEKPKVPKSNYAVTGLYLYDRRASAFARQVRPSARGELEITALNQMYLELSELNVELLEDDTTWLDTGTHKSMLQAAQFVNVIEERQGRRICCPEMIAYEQNWISREELEVLAAVLKKSGYGEYLLNVISKRDGA